jgi:HPr kinase/phosphorylase
MSTRRQFSVAQLYEDHRDKLKLSWVIAVGVDRQIELKEQGISAPTSLATST